jgi:hypothetical protein
VFDEHSPTVARILDSTQVASGRHSVDQSRRGAGCQAELRRERSTRQRPVEREQHALDVFIRVHPWSRA